MTETGEKIRAMIANRITVDDTAGMLNKSPSTVNHLLRTKQLVKIHVGKHVYVSEKSILAYLEG